VFFFFFTKIRNSLRPDGYTGRVEKCMGE